MWQKKIRNAGKGNAIEKAKRKIRNTWVTRFRNKVWYKYCYISYWHSLVNRSKSGDYSELYFAARPNPGAGIGHQMANWIAGYWFAKELGLKYAHIPFSDEMWENFLGFYSNEETVEELKKKGYRIVRIQKFDEDNEKETALIKQIISSYNGTRTVFLAEQDQFYKDQYGVRDVIQEKFFAAPAREKDRLIYDASAFNIAIHVRRGDIVQKQNRYNANLSMRFQKNDYFVNALDTALKYLNDKNNIQIYLFSQGKPEDFKEFTKFENMHFCLDMSARDSFLHMVYADALITSKSSFSYKPALLNRGVKFSPAVFWHGYPDEENWILLDEYGLPIKKI